MNDDLALFRDCFIEEAALAIAAQPTFPEKIAGLYGKLRASTLSMIFHPTHWQIYIEVLKDEDVVRFVCNLMSRFLARYSDATLQYDLLCNNLEVALCLDGPETDLSLLPETITAAMPLHLQQQTSRGTGRFVVWKTRSLPIARVLKSNKVLVCLLLIGLTSTVDYLNPKTTP